MFFGLVLLFVCSGTSVVAQTIIPSWEVYNEGNSPLPNNTIRCLEVDKNNELWIGTDHGLAHLNNGVWQVFNTANSNIGDDYIRALAVDSSNAIWIGTTLNGLVKYDGNSFQSFNVSNSAIPDNYIKTISIDRLGHKWLGTVEGLTRFDGTSWVTWTTTNSSLSTNNIASIGVGLNNEKFIGTINGGLIYMDNAANIVANYYILNSGVPDNSALKVEVDVLGKPWYAGSAGGLFTDPGNQSWISFNMANSYMLTNSLTTMKLDAGNNMFMGTQLLGLMIKRNNATWTFYSTANSDLPEDHILSITTDANDNVWIGTYSKGLVKLHETILNVDEFDPLNELRVFPNPAKSNQPVYLSRTVDNATVTIVSADGKIVHSEFNENNISTIHLPPLSPGYYFLSITRAESSCRLKLQVLE